MALLQSLSLSDRRIESGQDKRKRGRAAGISPPYFILTDRLQHPFKNFICTFAITGNTVCSTALNVHKIRLQVKCTITNVHNKNTNNQNKHWWFHSLQFLEISHFIHPPSIYTYKHTALYHAGERWLSFYVALCTDVSLSLLSVTYFIEHNTMEIQAVKIKCTCSDLNYIWVIRAFLLYLHCLQCISGNYKKK